MIVALYSSLFACSSHCLTRPFYFVFCFFFNDPATTEIYTLSLHDALPISTNFIAKMLAEDIENMPAGQLEAIRATGASFPKLLIYCISPQALPRYLGVAIYRLDANIRHSTVVGIVGAGGIGQVLAATFTRYDYDFSLAILMCIVGLVFIGEFFSNWVRGRLR